MSAASPASSGSPASSVSPVALRASAVLAGAAVLSQVAYPLTAESARPTLTVVTVVVFAAASTTHAYASRGAAWALRYVLATVGVGFLAEAVGVATGLPFGAYAYSDTLGPRLLGVPIVIPLAWAMLAYPAYVAARRLVPYDRVPRVAVAAWALASWDLFLDPQMVDAGHWSWEDPSPALPGVPGVPLGNYAGWLLVSAVVMGLIEAGARLVPPVRGPAERPDAVPHALYLWTWFSCTMASAVFFGNPGAAVWGGLAMGLVAVPLTLSLLRPARSRAVVRGEA